jgi:phosphate:Na+ symporter
MESSLRLLAGRKFKLFLKHNTQNRLKAIAGGTVVTGLLQSSSIVNLLLLSMVGAGVVKMENALALLLGSNLGSTFNSWIVAVLGFNFSIEAAVLPVAGIAGIALAFIGRQQKIWLWFKFIFGLSFLFVALGFIKSGMEGWVKQTDLSAFNHYPLIIFLLLGILLTAVVQSSSATMAITLSALYANAIHLPAAMALVLGAEIGTTLKLFIAAAAGPAVKKRVALGNFLFNIITVMLLFLFLRPAAGLITKQLSIQDPLIALVLFQTMINLASVILFFPFLKQAGQFLLHRYPDRDEEAWYISHVNPADTPLAMEALENETALLIRQVTGYSTSSFHLEENDEASDAGSKRFRSKNLPDKYEHIKQMYGEMHAFYLKLQHNELHKSENERLGQLISAIRNIMYAAKNIKDAQPDIEQTRNSSNDLKYNFYNLTAEKVQRFYGQVAVMTGKGPGKNQFEALTALYQGITAGYAETLQQLYKESLANRVNEIEISTLINFNRQLYTSFKSVLFGLKDFLLSSREAEYFDSLPGFIR